MPSQLIYILAAVPSLVVLGLVIWLRATFTELDQLKREHRDLQARLRESHFTSIEMAQWVTHAAERGINVANITLERARNLVEKV